MLVYVDSLSEAGSEFPEPVPETEPRRQRDLWRFYFPWVKTAVGASPYDDSLVIENRTSHLWMLWHRYHALGSILPESHAAFRLVRAGLLTAQQYPPPPRAEHILLELVPAISAVAIVDVSGGEGFYAFEVIDFLSIKEEETPKPTLPITRMIEELGLSAKLENALKRQGITTVEQLASMELQDFASLEGLSPRERKELLGRLIRLDML